MIKTPAWRKPHRVTLDHPRPEDAVDDPLTPAQVYAAIEPTSPAAINEDHVTHLVIMDYHPEVTLNTRITTADGRHLYVRGLQDVELRHVELRLLCEEVLAR